VSADWINPIDPFWIEPPTSAVIPVASVAVVVAVPWMVEVIEVVCCAEVPPNARPSALADWVDEMAPLNISESVDAVFPFTSPLCVMADPSEPVIEVVWLDCDEPDTVFWVAFRLPKFMAETVLEYVPAASIDPVWAVPESAVIPAVWYAWV